VIESKEVKREKKVKESRWKIRLFERSEKRIKG